LSGSVLGAWKTASVIDPVTNTRSYATNAYLLPAVGRPNLQVLTEAYVTKIVTSKSDTGEVVAQGVEFQHDGSTHVVHVAKEAILSSGTIKSPQILELSGIGDRAVLQPLGVPVQVDIPSVGTNVQEHITHNAMAFLMHEDRGIVTSDLLRDPAFLANFVESNPDFKGLAFTGLNFVSLQSISRRADEIISELEAKLAREAVSYPPGLREQYEQQLKHLKDPNVPDVEIMVTPFSFSPTPATKPIIAILPTLIHPFSRGTIHAASADPTAPPAIDPHYFAQDADLAILTEAWKFARKVAHTSPFSTLVATEVAPGPAVQTDEQIKEYVVNNFVTTWREYFQRQGTYYIGLT
ncbi:Glucose oxidase, partial [Trametes pubescens]